MVWLVALSAVVALGTLACAGGSPSLRAETVAAPAAFGAAEDAVRSVIESQGAIYAGDCASTRSPEDIGKVCSKQIDARDDLRAYLIGRTFSEFSTWVFVEQGSAGWTVAGTAPLDFSSDSTEIPWPR